MASHPPISRLQDVAPYASIIKRFEINRSRAKVVLDLDATFARGSLSKVFVGTIYVNGQAPSKVVAKFLHAGPEYPQSQLFLASEVSTVSHLIHPNVARFHGLWWQTEFPASFIHPGIVVEFVDYDLLEYTKARPGERIRVLRGGVLALQYIHQQGITHGDVHPGNIRVDAKGNAKVIDFGLAQIQNMGGFPRIDGGRNPRYCAPEIFGSDEEEEPQWGGGSEVDIWEAKPIASSSDVFAFGMVFLEVMAGVPPYTYEYPPNRPYHELCFAVARGERPRLERYAGLSNRQKGALQRMWEQDPSARPTMSQVVDMDSPLWS
ncbi:TKL/TKL-ccin protein kinase [Coprinopsis cinerea okayama7|uniref:TKL/TKL-ccin protein kinase n=1 Tax=Coprinopsis cinerea (strain Okayama-7 / 130 / ATCC MYA-4618 / FGSC 9003) TaxID=240176 RepID=A8P1T2_COPC7|nr:TKL/TKL-ccin protein kinase [Coprinopsis cinerea okayama7\|eukprot:XP_001838171.2 TKL/TKL-ccin protein kinase [Coprinopsis cinerea okayama7\